MADTGGVHGCSPVPAKHAVTRRDEPQPGFGPFVGAEGRALGAGSRTDESHRLRGFIGAHPPDMPIHRQDVEPLGGRIRKISLPPIVMRRRLDQVGFRGRVGHVLPAGQRHGSR